MLSRRAFLGGAAFVLLIAILVIVSSVRRETNRQAALGAASKPFVDKGFTVVELSQRGDPTKLEANVEPGCVVATSAKPAKIKVTHPAGIIEGDAPILLCLCAPGAVSVSSPKEAGGAVLLRTDAAVLGGSRAFAYLPFKATTGVSDAACAEASLEGWLDAKRYPPPTIDNAILDAHPQWKKVGAEVVAVVKPEWPFAVVEIPANDCLISIDDQADDKVGYRLKGGSFLLGPAPGNLGWCTTTATTVSVQREGKGLVNVLTAPAVKVGGLGGLNEIAESAGVKVVEKGVPPSDLDWLVKQALLASDIPDSLIFLGRDAGDAEKDLRIAISKADSPGMLTPDTAEGVYSFCSASLDPTVERTCAFSGPQKWKLERHDAVFGLARAKLPFWLFGLKSVDEPEAMKDMMAMVALARRLKRDGFEPTTFEAVTETDTGAEVLGRAGEDAVVAVTLAPSAPWVMPLAESGGWMLGENPKVAPIKPLQRIQLVPTLLPGTKLPPKPTRRTVVWRHHA